MSSAMEITWRSARSGLSRWLASHWPGRMVIGALTGWRRLEIFDRAMALAAQIFTSVVPVLIMFSVWLDRSEGDRIGDAVSMPPATQDVLDDALDGSGGSAFGLLGTLFVLVSATSLSRALTRAMATVWQLSRPKSQLASAWRWVAVVLALALSVVVARSLQRFTDSIPPAEVWTLAMTFALDVLVAVFVPWLLLANQVPVRRLVPGALIFATAMLVIRPASEAFLPLALEGSAERYGTLGVAFTYLAWLYVVSFAFLAAAVMGNVVTEDVGGLGTFIRGRDDTAEPTAPATDGALRPHDALLDVPNPP